MMVGWLVVGMTGLASGLLIAALVKFILRWKGGITDIPMGLLLLAAIMGLPVIVYENLIFLHFYVSSLPLNFSSFWIRIFFTLSAVGVVYYNLYLLSIKDFPLVPTAFLSIMVGIALGGMFPSIHLDFSHDPILYYSPLLGGYLFCIGIALFNLVGFVGFSLALLELPDHKRVDWMTKLGVAFFMVSPILVVVQRVFNVFDLPLNVVFLPFLVSSFLHLTNYLWRSATLPILGLVEFLVILEPDGTTTKAFYPRSVPAGLPFLASVRSIKDIEVGKVDPAVFGSPEMSVVVHLSGLPSLLVVKGLGSKIGRICLMRLLKKAKEKAYTEAEFEKLVEGCFVQFMC